MNDSSAIYVGISACLSGQAVRYDGADKRSDVCVNDLAKYFEFVSFCPEVAAGFGIPRPPMHLVGNIDAPLLKYRDGGDKDLSKQLQGAIEEKLAEFSRLDGFILVPNSPSCGVVDVKVFQERTGQYIHQGQGLFAKALAECYPMMPLVEERQLHDKSLREQFIAQVRAYNRTRS